MCNVSFNPLVCCSHGVIGDAFDWQGRQYKVGAAIFDGQNLLGALLEKAIKENLVKLALSVKSFDENCVLQYDNVTFNAT